MINIVEVITQETKNYLNYNAVIDADKVVTYAGLLEEVNKTKEELKKLGLSRFKRVALLCDDSINYITISLAVLSLYAVIVPVPFGSAQDEINNILDDLKVNFFIFQKNSYAKKNAGKLKDGLFIIKLKVKSRVHPDFYKINPAFIRFTSGTTGTNKGVVLSHESIVERTEAANNGLKIRPEERIIWVLSMSFHFVVTILLFLRRGSAIIISSRKFPYELLDNLKRLKPTLIYASPLHYQALCNLDIPKQSLVNVRLAVSTAVKLSSDIAVKFDKKFGFAISEAYGIIELGLPFINLSKSKLKRKSVGRIIGGYQIKIIDRDNQGVGKIYIKGKGIFDAYFSPWRKAKDVLVKGWFNTGDLGRLDKEGFLFILGRAKVVINFCGMKIFPFEVESLINQYPQIKESLVYGQIHPEYGQLPFAKIVLRESSKGSFDLEKLRKFCYAHLASYKVPKEFIFVNQLPKTLSGKIKLVSF